jgi:hypothetical protein
MDMKMLVLVGWLVGWLVAVIYCHDNVKVKQNVILVCGANVSGSLRY